MIERITRPTDWCAPTMMVMKPSGRVRLCVNLKEFNKNIKTERYMLPPRDEILPNLTGCVTLVNCSKWILAATPRRK